MALFFSPPSLQSSFHFNERHSADLYSHLYWYTVIEDGKMCYDQNTINSTDPSPSNLRSDDLLGYGIFETSIRIDFIIFHHENYLKYLAIFRQWQSKPS